MLEHTRSRMTATTPWTAPRALIVTSTQGFAETAARWIAADIRRSVEHRGGCALALAGGSTPRPVYSALARLEVPWPSVHIFFGDERAVPPDDVASNFRMVREALLDRLSQSPAGVHRMEAERADLSGAADLYAALLPARLDLVVLGMGEDGHTASLFPGDPLMAGDGSKSAVAVSHAPGGGGPDRLTLTPSAIRDARASVVLVSGASKAQRVVDALDGELDVGRTPVQLARGGAWILDCAAAARLRRGR